MRDRAEAALKDRQTDMEKEDRNMVDDYKKVKDEYQGLLASEWGESDNKRKAKFYRLTPAGRRQLRTEADKWNRMATLMDGILSTTPEEI